MIEYPKINENNFNYDQKCYAIYLFVLFFQYIFNINTSLILIKYKWKIKQLYHNKLLGQ